MLNALLNASFEALDDDDAAQVDIKSAMPRSNFPSLDYMVDNDLFFVPFIENEVLRLSNDILGIWAPELTGGVLTADWDGKCGRHGAPAIFLVKFNSEQGFESGGFFARMTFMFKNPKGFLHFDNGDFSGIIAPKQSTFGTFDNLSQLLENQRERMMSAASAMDLAYVDSILRHAYKQIKS